MNKAEQRVAVTGATGFIGKALCSQLVAKGFVVSALVRDESRAASLAEMGVVLIRGSLADPASLDTLAQTCNTVIHCAGAVRGDSQEAFDQTNVAGLGHLITEILAQPEPPALLMLSSIAAREPQLSWYARSKHRAEQLLHGAPPELDWTILRPTAVYGPGDKEMLPVFQWMSRGIALVPGDSNARVSLIHVDDVVSAIIACLNNTAVTTHTYTLADAQPGGYNWPELAAAAASVWKRKVRLLSLPSFLLNTIARVNLALSKIFGYAPMLTPQKLNELRHRDWGADTKEFSEISGWSAKISLVQGLEQIRDSVL